MISRLPSSDVPNPFKYSGTASAAGRNGKKAGDIGPMYFAKLAFRHLAPSLTSRRTAPSAAKPGRCPMRYYVIARFRTMGRWYLSTGIGHRGEPISWVEHLAASAQISSIVPATLICPGEYRGDRRVARSLARSGTGGGNTFWMATVHRRCQIAQPHDIRSQIGPWPHTMPSAT